MNVPGTPDREPILPLGLVPNQKMAPHGLEGCVLGVIDNLKIFRQIKILH